MFTRVADLTWKHPKLVLAVVGGLALAALAFGHNVEHHLEAGGFTDPSSESEQAKDLLTSALGYDPNPGIVLLARAPGDGRIDPSDPAVRSQIGRLSRRVSKVGDVGRVIDPLRDRRAAAELIASDGRSLVLLVDLKSGDLEQKGGIAAEQVEPLLSGTGPLRVSIGGYAPSFNTVNDQTKKDLTKAEMIAFPILAILLLLVFRGVVAASIPLLIGGLSIAGTLLVLRLMSVFVDTSIFALNISTALSLGLAVDYALLMVSRYREEIGRLGATREAHRRTVTTAGRTAVFSGFTVAGAMAALAILPQRFLYSMAVAGAAVGVLSAVIAILVVPSLLRLLGTRIDALSIRRGAAVSEESGGWYRLARWVMRHPVGVALASAGLLLAAAAPFLSTTLTGPDSKFVPPGNPVYESNTYVESHYPRDVNEAVTVTVDGPAGNAALAGFERRIAALDGVARSTPFRRADRRVAFANFALPGPTVSAESQATVRAIRDLPPPAATRALVSGNTAGFLDQKQSLAEHLPLIVALVCGITLVFLFLLTGSVILPLKTLLMNAMTLGATFGIIVLSFEKGWLDGLFSYTGPAAVEVSSLVFLFAVVFGLATDYAVLVMARIKEQHDLGVDNEEAVAIGIGRTGRVITAAALCIAVVFLAFGVSSVFFMKQIAVGAAVGVLLDATVVRALLVPSLMRLLGDWNWWAPRPLRRIQRRLGLSEA